MRQIKFTLTQAVEGYMLNAAARGLAQSTLRDYANTYRKFSDFVGENISFSEITKQQIEEFLADQDDVSKKTRLNYHIGLSSLWHWATNEQLVSENIVRAITPPKAESREIIPFTEAELKLLLGALERSKPYRRAGSRVLDHAIPGAERNRAIILILVDTGLRASELCNIKIKDLDTRNRRILIMGKGAKERIVQYSPRTGQALWRYLTSRPDARPTENLFQTLEGNPMDRNYLRHMLDTVGERAKVPNVHPHRFRHTFAIQFLRNGGSPYVLQAMLGHSTLDMVKRYLHIAQMDIENAHKLASPVDNWRL